ncbi:hypothetical protein A3E04_01920 [Candidatus Kuenenbacteria bacterium RIFCSPHIGHO2_12_FULL_42_14]|uniref:Uncharacterized protein n=3 Tax=Candidatus Kueneniibacteriota TaxID=1752740 RepID=A0A0G1BQ83_9BACT|nr:MAG: hypothetical protein UV02_C0061G0006 [Candidatus Kuenenbacteria bacterium GW2011_GWA2_42_15]OGG89901.1 MAG: hypothetical protein A3C68_00765 [Candidatus Kuenenbacteria bacterium RIFCSPHIGHO2_02_FULL_42_29]OGG90321.1 MAG: hypothetical protein A3H55_00145 [Candidatus Kuenenbacteria bacterium RIFCSPLOWO2_02_FULL_42_16]OGG99104.1 MAG: hypothetical protein A3E04_01920 [Candidatus Kuenenbacteria bacterium RIFCSPHIGHO2_12_FULL_42_14]
MLTVKQGIPKKKLLTYLAVIGLMIVGNAIIYLRNSRSSSLNIETIDSLIAEPSADITVPKIGDEKSVLENNLFYALKKIGDWPVVPKNVGKADPFAPFFAPEQSP